MHSQRSAVLVSFLISAVLTAPALGLALTQPADEPIIVQETSATGPAPELRRFQPILVNPKVPISSDSDVAELPEPADVLPTTVKAVASKQWGLAVSGALLFLVLLFRKVGAGLVPALGTGKGAAWLSVVAGVLLSVFEVYQGGDPTLAVLVTAAASGFWSWAKSTGLVQLLASAFSRGSEAGGAVLQMK